MVTSQQKRKKIPENQNLVLFDEVNGICPKCSKPLMSKTGRQRTKLYEIAHIYPKNPRAHEAELLKDEVRLSEDVDDDPNLIALCRDCHKIFDNPRTISGYRDMVAIKQELMRLSKLKSGWFDNKIDEEISEVIESLVSFNGEATEELSYDVLEIDKKSDTTMNGLLKIKIQNNVVYFYNNIKIKFSELDGRTPYTSDLIYTQVKTYYIELKKQGLDQPEIFSALTNWIETVTKCKTEPAEIMVSFFVQNCEVYS